MPHFADTQSAEPSDGTPTPSSEANHKKDIKIIIGSSVGVGDDETLTRPLPGATGNLQGYVLPTLPMSQTTGQTPPTWTSDRGHKRPISEVSGKSQVGTPPPTQGPGDRRGQGPPPAKRRPDDDSASDRSLTDETPYLRPAAPTGKRSPPRGRVDEDDESEDPVYRPSSAYQSSSQAMQNWRNGTAGGASSTGQQPISASWGAGGGGGYQRRGASKFLATFGADPATRWSPFRKSPVTGADSDPAGPLPPPPPSQNPRGWTGPGTSFNVNDAQRDESSGNPDAPTDSPPPALAVAPSSGSRQPAASASQKAKVPKRQAQQR
ncbi:hypothetical protein FS837_002692 [Tulasnella sp. UAMH 9824]|nr:hypothetical protein FS837_002692 [Tulasnella sp. UAMH 9824]